MAFLQNCFFRVLLSVDIKVNKQPDA